MITLQFYRKQEKNQHEQQQNIQNKKPTFLTESFQDIL